MRKVLKWAGVALLMLLAVVGGLWSLSRFHGPTEAQKQALAVLAQKDVPKGRNAFAAIWLLPYDVPKDQLEAVTAQDMERFRKLPPYRAGKAGGEINSSAFKSVADGRFNRLTGDEVRNKACSFREGDCLAKVRSNPKAYSRWRNDNAKLIERVEAIHGYDYYRNMLPARLDAPFPKFQYFTVLPTVRALDFVKGRTDAAVDMTCRDISMYRKLSKGTDSLIASMIDLGGIHASSRLLAEMLSELPVDFPLPESCKAATVVPSVEEISLCNAMRGEAAYSSSVISSTGAPGSLFGNRALDAFAPLVYDLEDTKAILAPTYAWACSQEAANDISDDKPLRTPQSKPFNKRFECVGNFVGCLLADIASPLFDDYLHRSQDAGAQFKLLGTLLWLRDHADDKRPLVDRLASRLEDLKSQTRDIEIADGGKSISIRMFDQKNGKEFVLPLPPYLWDRAVKN